MRMAICSKDFFKKKPGAYVKYAEIKSYFRLKECLANCRVEYQIR